MGIVRPMGRLGHTLAAGLVLAATGVASAPIWPPPSAPAQVNVTADSVTGWLPTSEQLAQVRKVTDAYIDAMDEGRAADAYGMLADLNRNQLPFSVFADELAQFNVRAGPVRERRVVTVTWTKDPAQAPAPGIHAAVDLRSRFANVDRHCGYLILYQAPSGGDFGVMREEAALMDNATAASIAKQQSPAAVDQTWAQASATCPNDPGGEPAPLPEQSQPTTGYPTVAAAWRALHSKPGVEFRSYAGWTVGSDRAEHTVWSFAQAGDAAYPSVVKRRVVQGPQGTEMMMTVDCESTKTACDNLVRKFEQLNARIRGAVGQRSP